MKITISTTVITFEEHDEKYNRLAVMNLAGVVDSFPPKDELGDRLMHRLEGMVRHAQHKQKEYLDKFPEGVEREC
ncbi:MAG: hypothetical protein ACE5FB_02375 [Candidatus Binatia bacterium]